MVFAAISSGDVDALIDLYSPDYTVELPYAEPELTIVGRDEALGYLKEALAQLRFSLTLTEVYPSADPDLVIAEYASDGEVVATGAPYRNRYIGLWWFRDGRACRAREFFNPTALS